MKYNLNVPTRLHFGEGSMSYLEEELKGFKKVLLTYGGGSIKRNGLYDQVTQTLSKMDIDFIELSGISPNPRLTEVEAGIALCNTNDIDLILAVGGGSVIDCSKAIAVGSRYDGNVWDIIKGTCDISIKEALPLGVVLTLSATGSESNANAVISNLESNEKIGFGISPVMFPKFSILDPKNTLTVPKNHTINGVVDIIAHLFEQYYTPKTDDHAVVDITLSYIEKMVRSMMRVGLDLVNNLDDIKLREEMLHIGTEALNSRIGSFIGGDWSSHSIEHSLSAYYDIAHGAGLAIVYPNWLRIATRKRTDRIKRMAINIFDVESEGKTDLEIALEGIDAFTSFLKALGAPTTLSEVGIDNQLFDEMVEHSMWGETVGSYVKLDRSEVNELFVNAI